jgi:hypothetical protein
LVVVVELSHLIKAYKPDKNKNGGDNYWFGTHVWEITQELRIMYRDRGCEIEFGNSGRNHDFMKVTITFRTPKPTG